MTTGWCWKRSKVEPLTSGQLAELLTNGWTVQPPHTAGDCTPGGGQADGRRERVGDEELATRLSAAESTDAHSNTRRTLLACVRHVTAETDDVATVWRHCMMTLQQKTTTSRLYSLVFVDLSHNRISHVPAFWLDGLRHLQVSWLYFISWPTLVAHLSLLCLECFNCPKSRSTQARRSKRG